MYVYAVCVCFVCVLLCAVCVHEQGYACLNILDSGNIYEYRNTGAPLGRLFVSRSDQCLGVWDIDTGTHRVIEGTLARLDAGASVYVCVCECLTALPQITFEACVTLSVPIACCSVACVTCASAGACLRRCRAAPSCASARVT